MADKNGEKDEIWKVWLNTGGLRLKHQPKGWIKWLLRLLYLGSFDFVTLKAASKSFDTMSFAKYFHQKPEFSTPL